MQVWCGEQPPSRRDNKLAGLGIPELCVCVCVCVVCRQTVVPTLTRTNSSSRTYLAISAGGWYCRRL